MVRVLHFVSSLNINSGVMAVIMNYYRFIDKNEIQFDFVYFREFNESYTSEIKQLGGNTFYLRTNNKLEVISKVKSFLSQYGSEFDILHIHEAYMSRFLYKCAHQSGINKVVVHSHTTRYSDSKIGQMRNKALCHNIWKYADELFACSIAAGDFLYKGHDFFLMKNAIDVSKYRYNEKVRKEYRMKLNIGNSFVIGHVGRFDEQKNHRFILDVFSATHRELPNSKLLLVGDGPLKKEIEEKVRKLNLEDAVLFLGRRNDTEKLYQAMDCFILPSLYEGLPMVGVEAQAAGLPCIFSDSITEEVNLCNSIYLPIYNSALWSKATIGWKYYVRVDSSEYVSRKGFDIRKEAYALQKKYKEMLLI